MFESNEHDENSWQGSQRHLRVQYAIVSVLSNSVDLEDTCARVLQIICQHMGWDVGVIWRVAKDEDALICLNVWHQEGVNVEEFAESCRRVKYAKGQGVPGLVWQEKNHVWNDDVSQDSGFLRMHSAERYGLHAAFGFPIVLTNEVIGVIEFFSHDKKQLDADLLDLLQATSVQLGQFIERLVAQQALTKTEQRTLLLEQREDFTATLTHDLKGPLLGVNRIVELVADGKLGDVNDQQRSLLLQIINTNKGCLALIQDMLDVFRYEKNIHSLSLVQTDVREIIKNSVTDLSPLAHNRGIDIKLDMPSDFSMAEVDQTSIRRVLQNLIDNAIKFSETGKEVTVKAWCAGDKIYIAVKDRGPGISQEDSGKLFQRCFQGAAGKESNRGMGLGLYLCKQIVDAHKGEIKCDSEENVGSTFTVSLPACHLLESTI